MSKLFCSPPDDVANNRSRVACDISTENENGEDDLLGTVLLQSIEEDLINAGLLEPGLDLLPSRM